MCDGRPAGRGWVGATSVWLSVVVNASWPARRRPGAPSRRSVGRSFAVIWFLHPLAPVAPTLTKRCRSCASGAASSERSPRTRLGSFSAPSSRVPDLGRRDDGSFGVEAVPTYGTGRLTGAKEAVVAVIRGARAATGPVWGAQGSHSVPAEKSNISLGKKER